MPIETLAGVGPKVAAKLTKLGVERVGDLLCLLPQRYEDRTAIRPLGGLGPGEKVLIEGEIELAEVALRRRRSLLCRVSDGTGAITLRFFHFNRAQQHALARGARVRCYGEVRTGPAGLEMVHPEHRVIGVGEPEPTATLTPVYPTTEGLHQLTVRRLVEKLILRLQREPMPDYLDDQLPAGWPDFTAAIVRLHNPPVDTSAALLATGQLPEQRRLALEELVAQRLGLRRTALAARSETATPLQAAEPALERFRAGLGFELTSAQARAAHEMLEDLAKRVPMTRLLQGDVGSGKTVVAALGAVVAASAGYQTAVMAPTELLAEQHFANFARWLEPLGIGVTNVMGSLSQRARTAALEQVASGAVAVAVGTHALFQESVRFNRLALVVVDEQHRFGVQQRLKLRLKGEHGTLTPHQLIMTATPIPRTLAMTAYADLDCSVIDELPPGRQPVRTVVMPEQRRIELVERVGAHCRGGEQAYWVCPLIEESETVDSSAASALAASLAAALPSVRIGLIHGRMKAADKETVMRAFKNADLDLLVATTVIEVGVDVPRATLMIVENAERMGLAQLHQLRGRVGRGSGASTCVLLYKPPLSQLARERLKVMRETNDGFEIAQKDLQLRGPGEVLGTRQTGVMQLRIADLLRDAELLPLAIEISERLLTAAPDRVAPLIGRWVKGAAEYAKV